MPKIWYIAAGYVLPAGIEAYLLHYATEMRQRGFDPRIVVFERLPRTEHRYLKALRERGLLICSLYDECWWIANLSATMCYVPWRLRAVLRVVRASCTLHPVSGVTHPSSPITHYGALRAWFLKRYAVRRLARMINVERPDVIHVKGRLIDEAWDVFPSGRTIYQHTLSGTIDPSWEPQELAHFSRFLNRVARVLVQGRRIATTMTREYRVDRPIDVVYSMVPDEAGGLGSEVGARRLAVCGVEQSIKDADKAQRTATRRGDGSCVTSDGSGEPAPRHPIFDPQPSTLNTPHASPVTGLRFGTLCRFTEQKGIRFILEALRTFKERHGDVRFTFAGLGELEDGIRQFAEMHQLAHVGVARVESPVQTMRELDVFVHPGLDDAMPVSIVEALMCGLPCIVSDVGACDELVRDGIEGLVVAPGSSAQILAAMERFAGMDQETLTAFARRARARYEECCTPTRVGAQIGALYQDVMGGRRAPCDAVRDVHPAGCRGDRSCTS